jgi:hypothetical protein
MNETDTYGYFIWTVSVSIVICYELDDCDSILDRV